MPFVSISVTTIDGKLSTFLAGAKPVFSGDKTGNPYLMLRLTLGALHKNSQRMTGIRTEISTQMKKLAQARAEPFAASATCQVRLLQTNGDRMRAFDVIEKTHWKDLTPAINVGKGIPETEKWGSEVIVALGGALRLRIPVQKVAVTVEWPPNWAALKAELSSTWGTKEAEDFSQEDEDEEEEDEEGVEGRGGRTRSRRKKSSTTSPSQITARAIDPTTASVNASNASNAVPASAGETGISSARQPLASPARPPSKTQPELLTATTRPSFDGDQTPADSAASGCHTARRGDDSAWALAVGGEDDGADVALRSAGPSRHKCIFGRRDNDKENKEPAPHTEPPITWVMCQGTCKVEFGWSVESQAFYRTQNRPPPRFCLFCADERNKRKKDKADRYVSKRARAYDT